MEIKLKNNPRDMQNDLFTQLSMGVVQGTESGLKTPREFFYPIPNKTLNDYTGFYTVTNKVLKRNPDFIWKVRAVFIFRIMTLMLNNIYGKHIDQLEALASDAVRSLRTTDPASWSGLETTIHNLLATDVCPPSRLFPVERLCKAILPLIFHNSLVGTEELARSIYVYLDAGQKKKKSDIIRYYDDLTLSSRKAQLHHSVFAMHLASIIRLDGGVLHVGDLYRTIPCVRDFEGYVQCLMNLKYFHVDPDMRFEFVKILRQSRQRFISRQAERYTEEDYYELLRHINSLTLPFLYDFNRHSKKYLIEETSFNNILPDIHWTFFTNTDE